MSVVCGIGFGVGCVGLVGCVFSVFWWQVWWWLCLFFPFGGHRCLSGRCTCPGDCMTWVCIRPSCLMIGVHTMSGEIVVSFVRVIECLEMLVLYPDCWEA